MHALIGSYLLSVRIACMHSFVPARCTSQVLVDVVLFRERALSLLSDMSASLVTLTVSEGVGEGWRERVTEGVNE